MVYGDGEIVIVLQYSAKLDENLVVAFGTLQGFIKKTFDTANLQKNP